MLKPLRTTVLRQEEMQDIISTPPAWLVRWGITLFWGVLVLILGVAWFVRYPDIVVAPLQLTSSNTPKPVTARASGRLLKLLVQDNQFVAQGTLLAYLEGPASYAQVLALHTDLLAWQRWMAGQRAAQLPAPTLYTQLGEVQASFGAMSQAAANFRTFLPGGLNDRKRTLLQAEFADLQRRFEGLQAKQALQREDVQLGEGELRAQQELAKGGAIAPLELKREQSKQLTRRMPYQEMQLELVDNHSAQLAKQKEIVELDKEAAAQKLALLQAVNACLNAVETWRTKYCLLAPLDGGVRYYSFLQENQFVEAGTVLFFVSPKTQQLFGEMAIPQYNFGKVHAGQRVIIKLDGYPYQEFGAVEGRIASVSEIPTKDNTFTARVVLMPTANTPLKRPLVFKLGMHATAEIVTQERRLLARVFNTISAAFTKR